MTLFSFERTSYNAGDLECNTCAGFSFAHQHSCLCIQCKFQPAPTSSPLKDVSGHIPLTAAAAAEHRKKPSVTFKHPDTPLPHAPLHFPAVRIWAAHRVEQVNSSPADQRVLPEAHYHKPGHLCGTDEPTVMNRIDHAKFLFALLKLS